MNSRIIITDPHGCAKTLKALVAKLPSGVPITIAGDLIDRGPDSKGVIEFILEQGYDVVKGNHEVMMLSDLRVLLPTEDQPFYRLWIDHYNGLWTMNGGTQCLMSYLLPDKSGHDYALLKKHLEWMESLPLYLEYNDVVNDKGQHLLVTHSSAGRVWNLRDKSGADRFRFNNEVIWCRESFPPKIEGIYNVFGHTPQAHRPTIKEHFACIDGGCYLNSDSTYGRMYAFQFPEMIVYEQENLDIEPKP